MTGYLKQLANRTEARENESLLMPQQRHPWAEDPGPAVFPRVEMAVPLSELTDETWDQPGADIPPGAQKGICAAVSGSPGQSKATSTQSRTGIAAGEPPIASNRKRKPAGPAEPASSAAILDPARSQQSGNAFPATESLNAPDRMRGSGGRENSARDPQPAANPASERPARVVEKKTAIEDVQSARVAPRLPARTPLRKPHGIESEKAAASHVAPWGHLSESRKSFSAVPTNAPVSDPEARLSRDRRDRDPGEGMAPIKITRSKEGISDRLMLQPSPPRQAFPLRERIRAAKPRLEIGRLVVEVVNPPAEQPQEDREKTRLSIPGPQEKRAPRVSSKLRFGLGQM